MKITKRKYIFKTNSYLYAYTFIYDLSLDRNYIFFQYLNTY